MESPGRPLYAIWLSIHAESRSSAERTSWSSWSEAIAGHGRPKTGVAATGRNWPKVGLAHSVPVLHTRHHAVRKELAMQSRICRAFGLVLGLVLLGALIAGPAWAQGGQLKVGLDGDLSDVDLHMTTHYISRVALLNVY